MARQQNVRQGQERGKPRNIMNNQQNFQIAKAQLFDVLNTKYADKKGVEAIETEESNIDTGTTQGFLSQLNENSAINFGFLAHENLSLSELKDLNISSIPGLPDTDTLRIEIEKSIVKYIKKEFKNGLQNEVKRKFLEETHYHNDSLPELLNTIELFPTQLNIAQEKKEFTDFASNFVISFSEIKNNLAPQVDPTTGADTNENLNTKNFSDWTESQQKTFDYLFSKTVLQRLKKRLQWVETVTENVTSVFSLPLSLSSVYEKYPFEEYNTLLTYATEDEKNQLYGIDAQLQNASQEDKTLLEEQTEELYWKRYLRHVETSDPQLANILGELYINNFDIASLNQNPASRDFFVNRLAQQRLDQMKSANAIDVFGTDHAQFEKYFKDLFDFSKNEINVNGISLHIEKELIAGENKNLKDLSEFINEKEFPIKFKISGLENLNLSLEDQQAFDRLFAENKENNEIVLKNEKIGKLLILYFMGNPGFIESYNPNSESSNRLEQFFNDINKDSSVEKKKRELMDGENNESDDESQNEEKQEEGEESEEDKEAEEKEKFLKLWNGIQGEVNSSAEDNYGFKTGATLYIPFGESSLPPYTEDSNDWMRLKIEYVDWDKKTVSVKPSGVEQELRSKSFDYENKVIEFPFDIFQKRFLEGENLTAKPYKILSEKNKLQNAFNDMITWKLCDGDTLGDTQFEDGKLMMNDLDENGKERHEPVSYFGSGLNVNDKNKVLYKTTWNSNNTVTLTSSPFIGENGKTFEHKTTMTYPEFLVFIHEKGLSPKTKSMAKEEERKIKDVVSTKTRKIQWVSIGAFMYSIKNIWKKINDGITNYEKQQNEACYEMLVKNGLYKKLEKTIGKLSPALSAALTELHDEAMAGIEKKTWEGINYWISEFKKLGDYANLFENGIDKPGDQRLGKLDGVLGKFNTIKDVLISRTCVVNDDGLRPVIAAAMISNIKMGKGLYRGMAEYDNQGLWVQCLLGPAHYQRYLEQKKKLEADIKRGGPNATQLRDLLVKSEVYYIVNNIQNSHGKDEYFGSVSDSNQQALKQLYSNEFANQLDAAASEMTGQGAVESSYGKLKKMNTFNPAWEEFKKCIKSCRIEAGLGALMRMGELAVEPQDHTQLKVAISYVSLSGILSKYANKDMITRFDGIARAYMLPTAFFASKNYHQKYAWHLLSKASKIENGKNVNLGFDKYMSSKGLSIENFSKTSEQVPYGNLLSELEKWWTKNADDLDNFFLSLKTRNLGGDPILEDIASVLWEKNPDNVNDTWKAKPKIAGHFGLNQTPDIISRYKRYGKDGFEAKDSDERNDKIAFWKKMLTDLKNLEKNPEVKPEFFLKEFKNFFYNDGFGDRNDGDIIARIRLIKKVAAQKGKPMVFNDTIRGCKVISDKKYGDKEVNSLLWFLFKGTILSKGVCQPPEEFEKVLDFFQNYFEKHFDEISKEDVLRRVFSSAPHSDEIPEEYIVPWDEYTLHVQKEEKYIQAEEDVEETGVGILTGKDATKWKRNHFKSDYFVNQELVSMEKLLKKIGVVPPMNLSKPDKGGISITPNKRG